MKSKELFLKQAAFFNGRMRLHVISSQRLYFHSTVGLISKTKGTVTVNGIDAHSHFVEAIEEIGAIVENPEMYKFLTEISLPKYSIFGCLK